MPSRGRSFLRSRGPFSAGVGKIRHIFSGPAHILVYKLRTKEVIEMPEQDNRQNLPPQNGGKEDVDDFIFRTAPGWLASDR